MLMVAPMVVVTAPGCKQDPGAPEPGPAEPLQAVRTVQARTMALAETLDYVGTVRSSREVKVLARVMGTLSALPVAEGGEVRRGQVVARISVPEMDLRQQRLAADVRRLQADRKFLCEALATDTRLRKSGAVPQAKVDASERGCQGARQAVKAAQAAAQELRSSRGKAVERAPFSGRVLRWLAEPAEHAAPGRPLLLLGDKRLEVAVQVTETDLRRGISAGTAVTLSTGGGGSPGGPRLDARVGEVAPLAGGPGRTVEVRVPLSAERARTARHGASVDVRFILAREDGVMAVPEAALRSGVSGAALFIIDKGRARAVAVKPGITASGWVEVRPPPPANARVAVTNLDMLRDGMKVYAVAHRGGVK